MEKHRPEVIIESAEPLTDSSDQSESEDEKMIRKRPTRMNSYSLNHPDRAQLPAGMRPANSMSAYSEMRDDETEEEEEEVRRNKRINFTPVLLVAASVGIGILIAYYGVQALKPALDAVVEAAEEITEESQ